MIRAALVGALVLVSCGGGGPSPETRVVVVIESDLAPTDEIDFAEMTINHGLGGAIVSGPVGRFPASFGVIAQTEAWFSGTVVLSLRNVTILSRSFSHVRFVPGTTRMFALEMRKTCLCAGTNCPDPETNPDCAPLVDPALLPFEGDPPIGNTVAP